MKRNFFISVIVIIAALIIFLIIKGASEFEPLGETVPIMGKNHIQVGAAHKPYNSNPPTSGPHAEDVDWGIYQSEILDENVIHNLEHGGVWITYQDKNNQELKIKLEELMKQYKSKIILSPRSANDSPVAMVSWGRIMKLNDFDADKINKFIRQYKNKGPEFIPD